MKQRKQWTNAAVWATVSVLTAFSFGLSVCVGQYPIAPRDIVAILTGGEVSALCRKVFWTLRLPRALTALMAGAGLGLAGNVFQTVFKNPLASPDLVGVAPGASLGAAVAIVLLGGSSSAIALGAFAGGLLAVALVMALARIASEKNITAYILAGIVMSAVAKALIMVLKFFADPANDLAAIEFWTMGSLANVTAAKALTVAPFFLFALCGLVLLRRQVDMLSLNEDECRMLGVRLERVRPAVLSLATLLVSSVVSVTGLVSFIGLTAPHIARRMLRRNGFPCAAMSALVGATIVTLADTLARSLATAEIPISILTTALGVPVLIYYLFGGKEHRE